MGLGINIKGITNDLSALKETLVESTAITDWFNNYSTGPFKNFVSLEWNENLLQVTLHPCEEPVYFEFFDNYLVCSAKTNSVGPGYHAYLVKLVERLGNDLKINWTWNEEEGEVFYEDETGYYELRDYYSLQTEMVRWLRALCNSYREDPETSQIMVSMPGGYPRIKWDYFALSPMGRWGKEWFEKVGALEPEDLHWAGKEFFIWWNEEPDVAFFKRTGIALLNVDCPWHYPTDDKEIKTLQLIDQCFEQARKIDPFIELPDEDWSTIKNFLAESETDISDTGYGYRKELMTFDLAGNWMIDLQGTMYHTLDENTEVYYDHERTVRSLAYLFSGQEQSESEYAESFFDKNENAAGAEVVYSTTSLAGKAIIYYVIEEKSEYWILQGVKVGDGKFLLSTICYPTEEHKEWAIETWNSVRR
jgi:hypothetical protein